MPLLLETGPATIDLGGDDGAVGLDDLDAHLAVVDQEEVAGGDVLGQALEGRAADVLVADDVFGGDLEDVTLGELVGSILELAEADLRALQVDEHGDGLARVVGRLADVLVDGLVHVIAAVAQVHPADVHAGVDDRPDFLIARHCRAECCDDFRASHVRFYSDCCAALVAAS